MCKGRTQDCGIERFRTRGIYRRMLVEMAEQPMGPVKLRQVEMERAVAAVLQLLVTIVMAAAAEPASKPNNQLNNPMEGVQLERLVQETTVQLAQAAANNKRKQQVVAMRVAQTNNPRAQILLLSPAAVTMPIMEVMSMVATTAATPLLGRPQELQHHPPTQESLLT